MQNGVFREVSISASGKYFAATAADAQTWGERLMKGQSFRVLAVDFSSEDVSRFYFMGDKYDTIGRAYYATMEQLKNYTIIGDINGN